MREKLGLEFAPFASPHAAGSLVHAKPAVRGVHSPSLYFRGPAPGAPFELHCEDHWLYSLNYLHRGAPKYWLVVPPHERKHLEKCLWGNLGARWGAPWQQRPPACSQFMRHLGVWVSPGALCGWDVNFELVEQRPGELMVTAPGAYHQGWNAGVNVAEAINFGDGASAQRAAAYQPCSATCYPEALKHKAVRLWWASEAATSAGDKTAASALSDVVDRALPMPDVAPWCSNDIARRSVDLLGAARSIVQKSGLDPKQVEFCS